MKCNAEGCKDAAAAGGAGLCERHADDLLRSRAYWTPGRLTLDPMSPSVAQLGLANSNMELPR